MVRDIYGMKMRILIGDKTFIARIEDDHKGNFLEL